MNKNKDGRKKYSRVFVKLNLIKLLGQLQNYKKNDESSNKKEPTIWNMLQNW